MEDVGRAPRGLRATILLERLDFGEARVERRVGRELGGGLVVRVAARRRIDEQQVGAVPADQPDQLFPVLLRVLDVAVREAIFAAVDREALRKVRFNGLNWEEPSSGSMMLLPFSEYYQDNYPVKETGPDAAKKVLSSALSWGVESRTYRRWLPSQELRAPSC